MKEQTPPSDVHVEEFLPDPGVVAYVERRLAAFRADLEASGQLPPLKLKRVEGA